MESAEKSPAHGRLLAGEVGELAGVSGTTIGQWARRGYIRSSQSDGDPRVYSVEDVMEALVVSSLLARGVVHKDVKQAIGRLAARGRWPLNEAQIATTLDAKRPRIALREDDNVFFLGPRGWQLSVAPPALEDVRPRLRSRS
ncbi:MAG: MerR family transcriptional regulator [Actinomycetota bacterium]|nr:MerR family transcriptional regulator [Actinomycetota bacterium]